MPHLLRLRLFVLVFTLALIPLPSFGQRITAILLQTDIYGYGIAVNSVTNKMYVADVMGNDVVVVDGATNQTTMVSVGNDPNAVVVNTVTNKIYVTSGLDDTMTVIDGETLATSTVNVGVGPAALAVNPVTNKIYVANSDDNTVTVIDGVTLSTVTLPVDEGPLAVAVNPVTNKIYVGNQRFVGNSTVTVIDGATNHTTTIPLNFVAYFNSGSESLVVNTVTNQIYALGYFFFYDIDGVTNNVSNISWPHSGCVHAIGVNSVTNQIYGTDPCSEGLDDVDGASQMVTPFFVPLNPQHISIDTVKNRIYVADPYDFLLGVLDGVTGAVVTLALPPGQELLATNSATNTTYVAASGIAVVAGFTQLQFVPTTPCRLVDTRTSGGPILGGTRQSFPIVQEGNCNIPNTAAAYSLNVTVVPQGPLGYLTIWPDGQFQPTVSTMNSLDGRIKANAAIVPAGGLGAIDIFASNTTNVVLDIDGYFAPVNDSTLAFYPLTPCRVADTRSAHGNLGGPFLQANQERDFPVLESPCIPHGITPQAYSLNFTAVPEPSGQGLGYLTVWPTGQPKPVVSTLNNPTGTIVANAAIVPAGTDGAIAVYPDGTTNLVIDINGYFAPAGQGGLSLYPIAPCRVIDTRQLYGAFSGELEPPVDVADSCADAPTAQAYVFNATVVPVGSLGFLTLWPDSENKPVVSTLNAIDAAITSNMAIVQNIDGKTDAFASGTTQLILDISSYFAP